MEAAWLEASLSDILPHDTSTASLNGRSALRHPLLPPLGRTVLRSVFCTPPRPDWQMIPECGRCWCRRPGGRVGRVQCVHTACTGGVLRQSVASFAAFAHFTATSATVGAAIPYEIDLNLLDTFELPTEDLDQVLREVRPASTLSPHAQHAETILFSTNGVHCFGALTTCFGIPAAVIGLSNGAGAPLATNGTAFPA